MSYFVYSREVLFCVDSFHYNNTGTVMVITIGQIKPLWPN